MSSVSNKITFRKEGNFYWYLQLNGRKQSKYYIYACNSGGPDPQRIVYQHNWVTAGVKSIVYDKLSDCKTELAELFNLHTLAREESEENATLRI